MRHPLHLALVILLASFLSITIRAEESKVEAVIRAHLEDAVAAQKAGNYAKATEAYRQVLTLAPGSAEIYQKLGLLYHLQNKFPDAVEAFEMALAAQPDLWASSLFAGIGYYKTNQFSKALSALENALRVNPKGAELEGHFWMGVTYSALGRNQDAARELEERLKLTPQDMDVLYYLTQARREFAPDEASKTLQRMLELDSTSYRVRQLEGEIHEKAERYPRALEAYKMVYQLKPELPGICASIGSVHWKMRQFEEAAQWLRKELELNPYHALASYQLGNICVYRRQPSLAVPLLQRALEGKVPLMDLHRDLGKAWLQLGEAEKALEQFRIVAKAEPEDDTIHTLMASAYRHQGRTKEETEELELFKSLNQKKLERAQKNVQGIQ
jgi:tetratricopeptide (TPR) repeat protein